VITVEYSGGNGSNYVEWGFDNTSPTHAGNMSRDFYSGSGTWSITGSTDDACFYVYTAASAVIVSLTVVHTASVVDNVLVAETVSIIQTTPTATRYSLIL
jgi:hypothetical protein